MDDCLVSVILLSVDIAGWIGLTKGCEHHHHYGEAGLQDPKHKRQVEAHLCELGQYRLHDGAAEETRVNEMRNGNKTEQSEREPRRNREITEIRESRRKERGRHWKRRKKAE